MVFDAGSTSITDKRGLMKRLVVAHTLPKTQRKSFASSPDAIAIDVVKANVEALYLSMVSELVAIQMLPKPTATARGNELVRVAVTVFVVGSIRFVVEPIRFATHTSVLSDVMSSGAEPIAIVAVIVFVAGSSR